MGYFHFDYISNMAVERIILLIFLIFFMKSHWKANMFFLLQMLSVCRPQQTNFLNLTCVARNGHRHHRWQSHKCSSFKFCFPFFLLQTFLISLLPRLYFSLLRLVSCWLVCIQSIKTTNYCKRAKLYVCVHNILLCWSVFEDWSIEVLLHLCVSDCE